MNEPFLLTFQYLSHSESPHAISSLIAGLAVNSPAIRAAATEALILRRQNAAHLELIRRIDLYSPGIKEVLARNTAVISYAIRQSILQGDDQLRANALAIVAATDNFQHLLTLIQYLERPNPPDQTQVIDLIRHLADSFYQFLRPENHTAGTVRDPLLVRDQLLETLERSINSGELENIQIYLECLFILAPLEHRLIKNLLRPAPDPIRTAAEKLLFETNHPAIMSKIVELMGGESAPLKIVQIIRRRTDPEFISHLIRSIPVRLSQNWLNNFKRLDSIEWLENAEEVCEQIPPSLHLRLVNLVSEASLSDFERHRVLTWIMKHGAPEARTLATRLLSEVNSELVQELVLNGIESGEEDVQAWATTQLRVCKIPHAFEMLIERLDSPLLQVREAAREELKDFNLQRFLNVFDENDPDVCIRAGRLMQKIDPDFINQLRQEVEHPIRTKRLRAIRATGAMQLQTRLVESLLKELNDEEPAVRRAVVDVLKYVLRVDVIAALSQAAQHDKNARVREDAVRACHQMKMYMAQTQAAPGYDPKPLPSDHSAPPAH